MDSNATENGDLDRGGPSPTNAPSHQVDMATSMTVAPAAATTVKWDVIYRDIARLGHKFRPQFWRLPSSWSELVNNGLSISSDATCSETGRPITLVRAEWEQNSRPRSNHQPFSQETPQIVPTSETDNTSTSAKNTEIDQDTPPSEPSQTGHAETSSKIQPASRTDNPDKTSTPLETQTTRNTETYHQCSSLPLQIGPVSGVGNAETHHAGPVSLAGIGATTASVYRQLDVIELRLSSGQFRIVVFPRLHPFKVEQIRTVPEAVTFFLQMCELIRFMHDSKISAHPVWTAKSMASFVYPNDPGPTLNRRQTEATRSTGAIRTESENSRCYFVKPTRSHQSRDQSTSRHDGDEHCSACRSHIFCLGNLLDSPHFKQIFSGFRTEHDALVNSMTNQEQPLEINEVITGLREQIPTQPAPIPTDSSPSNSGLKIKFRWAFARRRPREERP